MVINMETPKYKRVLLKLSGEALSKDADGILNHEFLGRVADVIKSCRGDGIQIAVIVGAGNIWRGRQGTDMDRVTADQMGMLATTINALALRDAFERKGLCACVMTAAEMGYFAEHYSPRAAVSHLENGDVVIFGAGLGAPFFSTDTAAVLRAAEIEADIVLMAKNIDGVYTADPAKDPSAVRLDEITYKDILANELKALDMTATTFCMENDIKLYAFALSDPENIRRVIMGEKLGTVMHR